MTPSGELSVGPVSPETAESALRLAFSGLSGEGAAEQIEMFLRGVESGESPLEGLWEARRNGELVGAVAAQVQPGRVATVWPPRTAAREPTTTAQRLLAAVCGHLASRNVHMAHAILEKASRADEAVLREGGFRLLATLLYLMCPEGDFPEVAPSGPLRFEACGPANWDRLARLVEATYEETLDCPGLNGLRTIEDTLAGYRATGDFSPQRWMIVQSRGEDVGCLLLADHPTEENWELVYMGLKPGVRGRGWGRHVVRHAQWLTRQVGRPRLVLAVDAANHPAVAMYTAEGFRAWGRRRVYLRVLG